MINSPIISGSGIRGVFGYSLTIEDVVRFTKAFGSLLGSGPVVVGRDTRRSGPAVQAAVEAALMSVGCSPIDLGIVPTPTVQLEAMREGIRGGIAVTSSHNPGEWNALKLIGPDGVFLRTDARRSFMDLLKRDIPVVDYRGVGLPSSKPGSIEDHVNKVLRLPWVEVKGRRFKAVLDVTGGTARDFGPMLMDALGIDVDVINPDMTREGDFPRVAEPTVSSLSVLSERVEEVGADVGFAFDPDGDRLALVDDRGRIIGEEYTVALAIDHILAGRPGPCVVNLSTSRLAEDAAARYGCEVFRSPVGEVNVVEEMEARDALTGGEGNGGVIDRACHPGRDSGVGMACVISLLRCRGDITLSQWVDSYPKYSMIKTKKSISVPVESVMNGFEKAWGPPDDNRDGLWYRRSDGWIHVRPSGTEPVIRFIAESSGMSGIERDLVVFNETVEKLCVE